MGKNNWQFSASFIWNICLLSAFTISFTYGQYYKYWSPYSMPRWVNHQNREDLQCPESSGQFNHPKYCNLFLNCWAGDPTVGSCQNPLLFNEKIRACDFPRNVDCKGRGHSQYPDSDPSLPNDPPSGIQPSPAPLPTNPPIISTTEMSTTTTTTTTETPTTTTTTTETPTTTTTTTEPPRPIDPRCEEAYGTFVNPQNCSEYFVCRAGTVTVYGCPEGTYFDMERVICDYQRPANCPDPTETHENELGASGPVAAGTPTLPPPSRPQAPFRPKPVFVPEPPPQSTVDPMEPQLQEEDPESPSSSPTPINTVSHLKPKPPLRPEGSIQEEENPNQKPPLIDLGQVKPKPPFRPSKPGQQPSIPESIEPTNPPPALNPGSFKPPKPGGPPAGPSSTPAPVDGVDDPNILFPFLPPFPGSFKCPLPTTILPVVGDCESLVVCLGGVGHMLRCPHGHQYDPHSGKCSSERNFVCPSNPNLKVLNEKHEIIFAYLPTSHLHRRLNQRLLTNVPPPRLVNWVHQK